MRECKGCELGLLCLGGFAYYCPILRCRLCHKSFVTTSLIFDKHDPLIKSANAGGLTLVPYPPCAIYDQGSLRNRTKISDKLLLLCQSCQSVGVELIGVMDLKRARDLFYRRTRE